MSSLTVVRRPAVPAPVTPGCVSVAGRSSRVARRWIAGFTAVLFVPPLAWLVRGRSAPIWSELTTVTGLLALSTLACTVVLACRLRALSRAVGMTAIMYAHRLLGSMTVALVLAHVACALAVQPGNLLLLSWAGAPPRGRAATVATAALAGLVAMGVLRHRIRGRYELWRAAHLGLAGAALVMAALHVVLIDEMAGDPVVRWVFAALTLLVVGAAAYRWHGAVVRSAEHVVAWVRPESDSVCTVALAPTGAPLRHAPGQFAWLRLRRGGVLDEHPFTLASAPSGRHTEVTVSTSGDFGTLLRQLTPGTSVWVDGPYGDFTVDDRRGPGTVMLAAGVGITPMMSMLRALAARRDLRPALLVRGAGTAGELVFTAELAALTGRMNLAVVEVLRRPPPGWTGPVGSVGPELLATVLPRLPVRHQLEYFVCGPPGFVITVLAALAALGVPSQRVHTEQFDPV